MIVRTDKYDALREFVADAHEIAGCMAWVTHPRAIELFGRTRTRMVLHAEPFLLPCADEDWARDLRADYAAAFVEHRWTGHHHKFLVKLRRRWWAPWLPPRPVAAWIGSVDLTMSSEFRDDSAVVVRGRLARDLYRVFQSVWGASSLDAVATPTYVTVP